MGMISPFLLFVGHDLLLLQNRSSLEVSRHRQQSLRLLSSSIPTHRQLHKVPRRRQQQLDIYKLHARHSAHTQSFRAVRQGQLRRCQEVRVTVTRTGHAAAEQRLRRQEQSVVAKLKTCVPGVRRKCCSRVHLQMFTTYMYEHTHDVHVHVTDHGTI